MSTEAGDDVAATAGDDDVPVLSQEVDDGGKAKKSAVVLSTLPLVFPATQKRKPTVLVEIDSPAFDLEGVVLCGRACRLSVNRRRCGNVPRCRYVWGVDIVKRRCNAVGFVGGRGVLGQGNLRGSSGGVVAGTLGLCGCARVRPMAKK